MVDTALQTKKKKKVDCIAWTLKESSSVTVVELKKKKSFASLGEEWGRYNEEH